MSPLQVLGLLLSGGSLAVFTLLVLLDASFWVSWKILLSDLRISSSEPINLGSTRKELAHRTLLQILLVSFGIAGLLLLVAVSLIPPEADRTMLPWLLAALLGASWFLVGKHVNVLSCIGFGIRLRRELPTLTKVASQLHDRWPRTSDTSPTVGRLVVTDDPNMLMVEGLPSWPFRERVGFFIRLLDSSAIQFDLDQSIYDYKLEFSTAKKYKPQSFTWKIERTPEETTVISYHVRAVKQFSHNWYLVSYCISVDNFDESCQREMHL